MADTNRAEVIREALINHVPATHYELFPAIAALDALTRELAETKAAADASQAAFDADLEAGRADLEATIAAQAERIKALEGAGRIVLAMNTDLVDAQLVIAAAINPKDYDTGTREAVLGKELAAALAPKEAQG